MSSHQASSKPRSSKCRHFCFPFDLHNSCPTCRESGKETIPVSPISLLAISVTILLMNRGLKLRMDVGTLGSKDRMLILAKMIWIYWVTMRNLSLVLKQTLRVLPKHYFPHPHVPNHYGLNLCLSKLLVLSHLPQVLHCKIKLKLAWKNPWEVQ